MTINRCHWLAAAEIILAVGVVGEASAQSVVNARAAQPTPVQENIVVVPASPVCPPRRTPVLTFWNRSKARLEKWCVSEEPDEVPLGQSVYQTFTNQVEQGIAARMILNDFDFEPGGANLNMRGRDKLPHLANLALGYPYRVIVERTDYRPGLAEMRRQTVLKELTRLSIPLPADRIVVGLPLTQGLSGVEALYMYENLLGQTKSSGASGGQGGGGQGGSGTGAGAATGTQSQPTQTPGSR